MGRDRSWHCFFQCYDYRNMNTVSTDADESLTCIAIFSVGRYWLREQNACTQSAMELYGRRLRLNVIL
jgi:hypothetical protein